MAGKVAMLVLVVCLGASGLIVEARTHQKFSASSYYGANETVTSVAPKLKETNETVDPLNRYPKGYPNPKHVWNKETGKYESANDTKFELFNRYPKGYPNAKHVWNPTSQRYEVNETITDANERYPHGYFGESNYEFKENDTLKVVKATAVVGKGANDTEMDPLNRYPKGYPAGVHSYNPTTEKYEVKGANFVETNDTHRYKGGYFGEASYDYKAGDTLTTVKSNGTYTEGTSVRGSTVEGLLHRYPYGYHNESKPKTSKTSGVSELTAEPYDPLNRYPTGYPSSKAAKTTTEGLGSRYVHGYYPDSDYTKQDAKPVSYTNLPSSALGYVADGAGCRTAYWADHPNAWPEFLKPTSTVEDAFGGKALEYYGRTTLLDALLKYKSDPYSNLLRAAVTAYLNSCRRGMFPLLPVKVVEEFNGALGSKEAAEEQAVIFETENVVSISKGNACT